MSSLSSVNWQSLLFDEQGQTVTYESSLAIDTDPNYRSKFRDYLQKEILSRAIPEASMPKKKRQTLMDQLTDEENLNMYIASFTTKTVNATNFQNQEVPEYAGDRSSETPFTLLMIENSPELDEDQATKIRNYYLKGERQTEWGRKLGLQDWILSYAKITDDTVEDTLEALYAALLITGNRVSPFFGYSLIAGFMATLVNEMNVDFTGITADKKTLIKEYFTRKRWPDTRGFKPDDLVNTVLGKDKNTLQFFLTQRAIDEISAKTGASRTELSGPFVQIDIDKSQNVKKNVRLFELAYDKLKGLGFDAAKTKTLQLGEATIKKVQTLKVGKEKRSLINPTVKSFDIKGSSQSYMQLIAEVENDDPTQRIKQKVILQALITNSSIFPSHMLAQLEKNFLAYGPSPLPREFKSE